MAENGLTSSYQFVLARKLGGKRALSQQQVCTGEIVL